MVNCTDMSNTVKSMNTTIRTHGRLYEIWSDGIQFAFVTIVSLVINLVERFNRNLKKVIHATYPKKKC